jgi:hypothetical protein
LGGVAAVGIVVAVVVVRRRRTHRSGASGVVLF